MVYFALQVTLSFSIVIYYKGLGYNGYYETFDLRARCYVYWSEHAGLT